MTRPGDPISTGETHAQPPAAPRAWASLLAVFVVALVGYVAARDWNPDPEETAVPAPGVVAGTPGGVVATVDPAPTPTPTPKAILESSAGPTEDPPAPAPTPSPASEPTTAAPTAAPTPLAATPTPAAPPPATPLPATPAPATPAPVVAVSSGPDDAVAAFYRYVAEGDFDAAYSLWSDGMKAVYPKQENLDGRFAETAAISFSQLVVAAHSDDQATVQANFTEHSADGGSREFIGYWELIRVGGVWLLDQPNY